MRAVRLRRVIRPVAVACGRGGARAELTRGQTGGALGEMGGARGRGNEGPSVRLSEGAGRSDLALVREPLVEHLGPLRRRRRGRHERRAGGVRGRRRGRVARRAVERGAGGVGGVGDRGGAGAAAVVQVAEVAAACQRGGKGGGRARRQRTWVRKAVFARRRADSAGRELSPAPRRPGGGKERRSGLGLTTRGLLAAGLVPLLARPKRSPRKGQEKAKRRRPRPWAHDHQRPLVAPRLVLAGVVCDGRRHRCARGSRTARTRRRRRSSSRWRETSTRTSAAGARARARRAARPRRAAARRAARRRGCRRRRTGSRWLRCRRGGPGRCCRWSAGPDRSPEGRESCSECLLGSGARHARRDGGAPELARAGGRGALPRRPLVGTGA